MGQLMAGLTAKVFRTYKAGELLQAGLQETEMDAARPAKLLTYRRANMAVAKLLNNHKEDEDEKELKDMQNELGLGSGRSPH